MANIKSAKKRIGVIEKKTQRNKRVKAHLREIIKGFGSATTENNVQEARDFLALAEKKLLQAGAKGTIHKNAATRKVSRLTKQFIKTFGAEALEMKANPPTIPTPEEKAARRAEKEAAREAALARKKGRRRDARVEAEKTPEAAAPVEASDEAPAEISGEVVAEEIPENIAAEEVSESADAAEEKSGESADAEEPVADAEVPAAAEEEGEAPESGASDGEDSKTPEENAD